MAAFSTPAILPTAAAAAVPADQPKYAAIVVDANSGEVLYARRADSPRYPASITKVMTLYLAFEALASGKLKTSDTIVISPRAAAQPPSKLGLSAGQVITVDDAMRALAIKSANDIAVALAEKIGGTESRFAALMTLRAQELGMTNTRFVNASGLPDSRQLSSARDIAILSRAVMRDYPQYYSYFSQRQWVFRGRAMNNHNGLLHKMPGVDGLKTGFTNASGYNLAASAVRDGRRLIAVVLGGTSNAQRDNNVAQLLNTGFDVVRRRRNGEVIHVAQSMFEAPPSVPAAPVAYASLGLGAGEKELNKAVTAAQLRGAQAADSIASAAAATMRVMTPVPNPPAAAKASVASAADLKPSMAARQDPLKTSRTKAAETKHADAKEAKSKDASAKKLAKKKNPDAVWLVQVGAFKEEKLAKDELKKLGKRFSTQLSDAEPNVSPGAGWYRARYEGLTKEAAKSACEVLSAKKVPCLMVKGD